MTRVHIKWAIVPAIAFACLSCGGPSKPVATGAAERVVDEKSNPQATTSKNDASLVLSDVSEEERRTAQEEARRKAAFENTASLAAPTPINVEVPVLLDYQHAEVVPQDGHREAIEHVAVSNDGRLILTADRDGVFKLITRSGATLLRTFIMDDIDKSKARNPFAAFSPDARRVLCIVGFNAAVFDTETGEARTVFKLNASSPRQIVFDRRGETAVLVLDNRTVELWNLGNGSRISRLDVSTPGAEGTGPVLLSPDGKEILRFYKDGSARVFDVKSSSIQRQLSSPFSGTVMYARFTDAGDVVLVGKGDRMSGYEIAVWNPVSGDLRQSYHSPSGSFSAYVIPPGETTLTAVIGNSTIGQFDLQTQAQITAMPLSISSSHLTLAPDGSCAVATDADRNVHIFEVRQDPQSNGSSGELAYKPDKTFRGATMNMGMLAVGNGASVAVSPGTKDSYIWDLDTGFMARHVQTSYGRLSSAIVLAHDQTRMLVGNRILDLSTGEELGALFRDRRQTMPAAGAFSPDDRRLAVIEREAGVSIYDSANRSEPIVQSALREADAAAAGLPLGIAYSTDGSKLLVTGDSTLLLSAADLQILRSFPVKTTRGALFPDGKHLMLTASDGNVSLWTVDGQNPVFTFPLSPGRKPIASDLSPDGKRLAVLTGKGEEIVVFDTYGKKKLKSLKRGNEAWTDIRFFKDADHLLTQGPASLTRVWNLKNERSAALLMDGGEWAICTDDGYFDASRRGGYLLALVQGTHGYRVDQLSIKYNRPDVVLRDLGLGTPELLAHYFDMYKKRLRKTRIDEDRVDEVLAEAPRAVIEKVEHKGKWVRLTALMSTGSTPLSRYNLYVNEVPMYGIEGQPVSGTKKKVEMTVELTEGINHLEVGVTNQTGIESLRDKYTACYTTPKAKHDLYYVGFGVSSYADSSLNLKYAAKDARELSAVFREVYSGYKQVYSKVFTDERVNLDAFIEAKLFLEAAGVDDTVVLFVAGHGLHDSTGGDDYYYLAYDTDIGQLKNTGVPFEAIESLLSDIKPRRKLFLLDTCQSGELDEGDENQILAAAGSRGLISRGIRKKNLMGHITPKQSLKKYLEERDSRFIYNDVNRRTGTMVISSSRGSEFSYEKDTLQNGVFTEEVYNAFTTETADRNKDKSLSIDELRDYVFTAVSEHTDGLQHPVVDRDNQELTFEFPIIKTAAPRPEGSDYK